MKVIPLSNYSSEAGKGGELGRAVAEAVSDDLKRMSNPFGLYASWRCDLDGLVIAEGATVRAVVPISLALGDHVDMLWSFEVDAHIFGRDFRVEYNKLALIAALANTTAAIKAAEASQKKPPPGHATGDKAIDAVVARDETIAKYRRRYNLLIETIILSAIFGAFWLMTCHTYY